MAKAYDDIMDIRRQFESMQGKMCKTATQAVEKRGVSKATDILLDVAHIQDALQTLSQKLAPPPRKVEETHEDDLMALGYM